MVDLLTHLWPQMPPGSEAVLSAALRALEEWLFLVFFVLGVTAFVRLLLIPWKE